MKGGSAIKKENKIHTFSVRARTGQTRPEKLGAVSRRVTKREGRNVDVRGGQRLCRAATLELANWIRQSRGAKFWGGGGGGKEKTTDGRKGQPREGGRRQAGEGNGVDRDVEILGKIQTSQKDS